MDELQQGIQQQQAFVREWPLARVRSMNLSAYQAGKESFCYALEFGTDQNGSIRGGTAFKFGIFKRESQRPIKARHLMTDGEYGWYRKHGPNREAAFRQVRNQVVQVIEAAQAKDFEQIDQVDLGEAVKWKIAFLYAPDALLPIYSRALLSRIAFLNGYQPQRKTPIAQIQAFLLQQKPEEMPTRLFAQELWQAYVTAYPGEVEKGTYFPEEEDSESVSTLPQAAEPQLTYHRKALTYPEEELLAEAFVEKAWLQRVMDNWKRKKNLILQGPPGVGKTFLARRLAYLLLGARDSQRMAWVQFHPSYAYEDFLQGLRPDAEGKFSLQEGKFARFCGKAQADPGRAYVFVIDEINRGNLSKVLGELFLLLEADKRGPEHAVELAYQAEGKAFFLPANLYLIGTMNTADRSLALLDYALRRRFSFVDLHPHFGAKFRAALEQQELPQDLIDHITTQLPALNQQISEDPMLGPGYAIGHSYFLTEESISDPYAWYETLIEWEIAPLLREYWYEDELRAEQAISELMREGGG